MPLLVGNVYPAHYLLVVGHEADTLFVYNPSGGRQTGIAVEDLRAGRLTGTTAFRHLHGILTPHP